MVIIISEKYTPEIWQSVKLLIIMQQQDKPSNGVAFFQCVIACTFDVDLIILVEVNSFLDSLKHMCFIVGQGRRYVDRSTLYLT